MQRFFSKSLPLAVFAFIVATFFMPDLALAAGASRSPTLESFAQTMSTLVHVLTAAMLLLLQFMPPLWGTDLITGPEIIGALKPMWMFIRNLMNMVFVLLLLITIFVNLLTSGGQMGGGQWTIKEKLGKIILGLVAVNFSLVVVKVLVDAAYVGTIGILTIADPAIDAKGTKDVQAMMDLKVDTEKYTVCEKDSGGDNCEPIREIINGTFCDTGDTEEDYCLFKVKDKIDVSSLGETEKHNVILAFGVHFMRIESLPVLAAKSESVFSVLDNTLFSFVMAVAYILALAAVFVVLIVRVVMMWVMILVSPILVTGWVMGWSGGAFDEINGRFWKYLVVPIKIAAVFSFTFILIATLDGVTPSPQFYTEYIEPGNPLKPLWGDEKFKGWQFVWKIFIVVLFWKAIFLAMKDIDDVSTVTGAVQSFGGQLGKTALTYGADQISIPGIGTAANLGQINSGLRSVQTGITANTDPDSLQDVADKFNRGRGSGDRIQKAQTRLQDKTNKKLEDVVQLLKGSSASEAVSQNDFQASEPLQEKVYGSTENAAAVYNVKNLAGFKKAVKEGTSTALGASVLKKLGYDGTDPTGGKAEAVEKAKEPKTKTSSNIEVKTFTLEGANINLPNDENPSVPVPKIEGLTEEKIKTALGDKINEIEIVKKEVEGKESFELKKK